MNAARRSKHLLVQAARNFLSDGGFNHAAAVAYYSILSLAPFLYLLSRLVEALLPGEGSVESTLSPLFGIVPEEAAPILNSVGEEIRAEDATLHEPGQRPLDSGTGEFAACEPRLCDALDRVHGVGVALQIVRDRLHDEPQINKGDLITGDGGPWVREQRRQLACIRLGQCGFEGR